MSINSKNTKVLREPNYSKWLVNLFKARNHLLVTGLFFLGSIHYTEPNNGGSGLSIPTNVVSWIVVSWLIGLGFLKLASNARVVYTNLSLCLLGCVFLLSFPTFFPDSRLVNESVVHYGLMGGVLFFFALLQYKPGLRDLTVLLLLALSGIIIEALGGWRSYLDISISEFSIGGLGSDLPVGAMKQRNVMATFMVMGLIISGYFLDDSLTAFIANKSKKILTVFVVLTPVIVIPLVVLLKSRTGWLAGGLSFLLLLPYIYAKGNKKKVYFWLGSVLIGLMLTPIFDQISSQAVVVSSEKLNLSGARNFFYPQIIDLAMEKPVLGHGFGSFENEYVRFSARGYAEGDYVEPAYANLSHPHNEILYWWVEGGIFGLAGILLAAILVLKAIFKLKQWTEKLVLLALLFPIVLHTQTELPFYLSIAHWILFIILLLLVDIKTQQYKEVKINYQLLPAILAVMIPVLTTIFMLTTIQSGRLLNRVELDMTADVVILEGITNPIVWGDRLKWDMSFGLLALSIYQQQPELAKKYIAFAEEIIKRQPRSGYYQFLVIAYKVVGDENKARSTQEEAEFLFPNKVFNFEPSVFAGIANKNIDDIQINMLEN